MLSRHLLPHPLIIHDIMTLRWLSTSNQLLKTHCLAMLLYSPHPEGLLESFHPVVFLPCSALWCFLSALQAASSGNLLSLPLLLELCSPGWLSHSFHLAGEASACRKGPSWPPYLKHSPITLPSASAVRVSPPGIACIVPLLAPRIRMWALCSLHLCFVFCCSTLSGKEVWHVLRAQCLLKKVSMADRKSQQV